MADNILESKHKCLKSNWSNLYNGGRYQAKITKYCAINMNKKHKKFRIFTECKNVGIFDDMIPRSSDSS
jgi:hypothetical protein